MDSLQSAAQLYSWTYMIRELDRTLQAAQDTALKELDTYSKELKSEESEIGDRSIRFHVEKDIEILDSFGSEQFRGVMRRFLINERDCSSVMNQALELSSTTKEPVPLEYGGFGMVDVYNGCAKQIDAVILETIELHDACAVIARFTSDGSESHLTEGRVASDAIGSIIPVLQARERNLELARALVVNTKESWCRSITTESFKSRDR
ncbi:hypothetical protein PM082_005955 [Marasmius tenuissimus]|nr:hypothetical protein PM082_005955 [Marasmius tenuissimus]